MKKEPFTLNQVTTMLSAAMLLPSTPRTRRVAHKSCVVEGENSRTVHGTPSGDDVRAERCLWVRRDQTAL